VHPSTRLLAKKYGNRTFAEILPRLRCEQCERPPAPAPVYLCAGHRVLCFGAPPDWAIELVPVPRPSGPWAEIVERAALRLFADWITPLDGAMVAATAEQL
jgi:hypothetical protein